MHNTRFNLCLENINRNDWFDTDDLINMSISIVKAQLRNRLHSYQVAFLLAIINNKIKENSNK